ncbi:hypothetical protein [Egbenema bharatensis]|uniref:hypothetical protein n=1 Tax=Egbenema bharatensis TaxID=3463334 RepID=UPI003A84EFE0
MLDSSSNNHQSLKFAHVSETYRISDIEDALVWTSPENRQILCPFDSVWSRNLAQEIVRELRNQP